jgi:lysophospholipase L1-like esterase
MNDGHGGALAITTAKGTEIDGWIATAAPDVTIMHFGTNDCWGGRPTDAIIDAFTTILGKIRKKSPMSTLMIAKIIPLEPRAGHSALSAPRASSSSLRRSTDGRRSTRLRRPRSSSSTAGLAGTR